MKVKVLLFLLLLCAACTTQSESFTKIENEYKWIDGQKQIISQKIETISILDSLPIAIRTKVYNYTDDLRIKILTARRWTSGLFAG
jgi:hypothetical protein